MQASIARKCCGERESTVVIHAALLLRGGLGLGLGRRRLRRLLRRRALLGRLRRRGSFLPLLLRRSACGRKAQIR